VSLGIEIQPNPPQAGQNASVKVPNDGPWSAYVRDPATGTITELGPLSPGADGTIEITLPAGSAGHRLTITDEGVPVPTEADYEIASAN
jgi:hypothetical protein